MIRPLAAALLALGLVACGREDPAPRAMISTQNAQDQRVAKELFGRISTASSQRSESIGFYSKGCMAGGAQLAETGPTWQAMRLSRNRNWAQPETLDYVQDLSRVAATLPGWNGIYVGDMSQPRGGPMLTGHASHQTGIDIDIWLRPADRLDLSVAERESISSIDMQARGGAYTNDNWTPAHEALLKAAASDPRTARIFIFPGAKVAMCDSATGDRSWLGKIRPWYGHNTHFHVRLNCLPGDPSCEGQEPPPPGDGCEEAREWQRNILNPPPPDPDAPPPAPKRETRMSDLPAQCASVLTSD
ncbi:penicillin-insensitive murein endopeptidase [Limimaricola pyoseonensis]|uniref:Penicillin-insensitive murein endopeptidase n=1 Tax=Limimaricola pyoseonensis TaxID=521013 RepID=A0A1G7ED57_9RHOB|nr:penicillin-insensitive murein endopeptidase [Limimaricola pyoseonensis]SDE61591.1 penicillin-insensitive murein endopeptidase [Limimaricola pyoseonensis]